MSELLSYPPTLLNKSPRPSSIWRLYERIGSPSVSVTYVSCTVIWVGLVWLCISIGANVGAPGTPASFIYFIGETD